MTFEGFRVRLVGIGVDTIPRHELRKILEDAQQDERLDALKKVEWTLREETSCVAPGDVPFLMTVIRKEVG